jgi:hypothetical protein
MMNIRCGNKPLILDIRQSGSGPHPGLETPASSAASYGCRVRFTLTYEGLLLARGRSGQKETIRAALHPQLAELWTHDPLSIYPQFLETGGDISVLAHVDGHVYAPLVCESLHLLAELDLLLLRPELPGGIVTSGGDIDNRLKTLFDALKVPSAQDVATTARASSIASPTFTLLEDDALIARVNVETDRLLAAPQPDFVRLVMRVSLRARKLIYGNMNLIAQ